MSNNGSGKWQLAFYIVSVICVGGMLTLTKYVVANDDKSTKANAALVDKIHREGEKIRQEVKVELKEIRYTQQVQTTQMANNKESLKDQMAKDKMEILIAIESLKKK